VFQITYNTVKRVNNVKPVPGLLSPCPATPALWGGVLLSLQVGSGIIFLFWKLLSPLSFNCNTTESLKHLEYILVALMLLILHSNFFKIFLSAWHSVQLCLCEGGQQLSGGQDHQEELPQVQVR
jgi:hypothetical protein